MPTSLQHTFFLILDESYVDPFWSILLFSCLFFFFFSFCVLLFPLRMMFLGRLPIWNRLFLHVAWRWRPVEVKWTPFWDTNLCFLFVWVDSCEVPVIYFKAKSKLRKQIAKQVRQTMFQNFCTRSFFGFAFHVCVGLVGAHFFAWKKNFIDFFVEFQKIVLYRLLVLW